MMEVYALAISFQMERLEVLCLQYLESNVSLNNVLAAFTIASQMALHSFKEFCLKFIIKDCIYNQVVMSPEFESLEKPLLLEVVRSHTRSRTSCRHGLSDELAPQVQVWPLCNTIPFGLLFVQNDPSIRRTLHILSRSNCKIYLGLYGFF